MGFRNHADDQGPGWRVRARWIPGIQTQTDAFAQRILARPVGLSRGLIDDRNLRRIPNVLVVA
jgi:hypothetical protein